MGKLLRCADVLGCDEIIYGTNDDEVIAKAEEHVRGFHNITLMPPDVVQKIVDHITDGEPPKRPWWRWRGAA